MPASKFLVQTDTAVFDELVNASSLPCFTTDYGQRRLQTAYPGRVNIPLTDVEASVTGNVEVTLQGNGKVTAGGALELTSAAKIGLNTPALSMGGSGGGGTEAATQGNIRHRGNITVTGGDVTVNGISFLAHVHDCPHGGTTGAPK